MWQAYLPFSVYVSSFFLAPHSKYNSLRQSGGKNISMKFPFWKSFLGSGHGSQKIFHSFGFHVFPKHTGKIFVEASTAKRFRERLHRHANCPCIYDSFFHLTGFRKGGAISWNGRMFSRERPFVFIKIRWFLKRCQWKSSTNVSVYKKRNVLTD